LRAAVQDWSSSNPGAIQLIEDEKEQKGCDARSCSYSIGFTWESIGGYMAVAALGVITAFAVPNLNTSLGESLIFSGSVACPVVLAGWSPGLLR